MRTGVAAKPTRPATSLLAVMSLLGDLRGQRASSACHRHRRHPVETSRPRWSEVSVSISFGLTFSFPVVPYEPCSPPLLYVRSLYRFDERDNRQSISRSGCLRAGRMQV